MAVVKPRIGGIGRKRIIIVHCSYDSDHIGRVLGPTNNQGGYSLISAIGVELLLSFRSSFLLFSVMCSLLSFSRSTQTMLDKLVLPMGSCR